MPIRLYETIEIGTPCDYTTDIHKVYFEIAEKDDVALQILTKYMGELKAQKIIRLAHGYELELPIQCIPDVVVLLLSKNGAGRIIRKQMRAQAAQALLLCGTVNG